jgi:hypothetical protein
LVAVGTLLPRANPAACPQLTKADFASSSQHVREGQRIGELEAEIETLQRQALALGAEPTADVPAWARQNPALQRAPNAIQNGTSLLDRPPGMPRHQPRRSCRIPRGYTKFFDVIHRAA